MNKQIICILLFFQFHLSYHFYAQELVNLSPTENVSKLFRSQDILSIKLSFSNKYIKKNTNDSTYIKSFLSYKQDDETWKTLDVELRARGNFRRKNCYFAPIKIKIKKEAYKKTLFKGHKKLKLVLPCLLQKDKNDNIIKEFIAYKLYELITPYNFKTRLVDVTLSEPKGKKIKTFNIKGILIEDDKKVAKRHDGKIVDRSIHPLAQDNLTCVQNSFFQFMIGNIDFAATGVHNSKLLFIENRIYPLPYDFDMCGLVNASYATVSQTKNNEIHITSVTQRQYRGLNRSPELINQVRQEFLNKKEELLKIITGFESIFENQSEYDKCILFISDFFRILMNDRRFDEEIMSALRG